MEGQMSFTDLDATWCGKTYPEPYPQTKVKTSAPSSKKQQGSKIRLPLFLDLRKNGGGQDASWVMGIPSPGELQTRNIGASPSGEKESVCWLTSMDLQRLGFCLTLNFSEQPQMANRSRLSDILEQNPDPRYHLSEKACKGILNRAGRRGKELPETLRIALETIHTKKNARHCLRVNTKIPPVVYGKADMANYTDNVAPLRASGGDCGMGSENLCVQQTYQDVTGPLMASGYDKPGTQEAANDMYVAKAMPQSVVRRLTPLECERLQGFPDGWTDIGEWVDSKGKKHKDADSPRYKALGNSIAVGYANGQSGFWCWLARRICAQYERSITIGSLFDGIGGFPLAFESAGAKAVWASEIEEFPIAVTKKHFPEEE